MMMYLQLISFNQCRCIFHILFVLDSEILASYAKKYAFKNAKTEDLLSTLSKESGVEVNNLMNTWTKQKGYPVVSVKLKDDMLEFEQVYYT